jgi:hypothetical protein
MRAAAPSAFANRWVKTAFTARFLRAIDPHHYGPKGIAFRPHGRWAPSPLVSVAFEAMDEMELLQHRASGSVRPPGVPGGRTPFSSSGALRTGPPAGLRWVDLSAWKTVALALGTLYDFPPRGDEQTSITRAPSVRRSRRVKGDQYDIKFKQAVKAGRRVEAGRKRA